MAPPFSKTRYTTQYMQNWGFDDTYKVPMVELLVYNPKTGTMDRMTQSTLVPFDTWVTTAVTLTDANTAYLLPTTEQVDRKLLIVYNVSDTSVYFGDASVTTSTGILLPSGGVLTIDAESNLYAVCGSSGKILNVLEGK
jgi:hypothetical protein